MLASVNLTVCWRKETVVNVLRLEGFQKAVREIERRAERVLDYRKLYDIYVDKGVLSQLTVNTNQLILGRRGVGKTHLVTFFRDYATEKRTEAVLLFDHRQRLGSGNASQSSNPYTIASVMFTSLLNDIATQSFDALDTIDKGSMQTETKRVLQF